MEKRNSKRLDPDMKSTKTAAQGDNIKENEKNNKVLPKTTNPLLQADRGDTKLKQARKSETGLNTNERKNDTKSKSTKDLIFQSRRGRLELKPSKPRNQQTTDRNDEKTKKMSPGDNYIVMDSQIKPFLNSKEPDKFNTDMLDNPFKNAGMDKRKVLEADERQKIREKYTIRNIHLKSKSFDNTSNLLQNDSSKKICNDHQQGNKMAESKSESTKIVKETDVNKSVNSKRKPVITTVRSKKDNTKVYKTVTFTDFKAEQRQPIQIKIPTDGVVKNKEYDVPAVKQLCDKATDASQHSSNKEKSINRKKRAAKLRRPIPSPEPLLKGESPPTEVAKWAPNSVNKQNKPYYEAWVDTTLAAITKCSKKDKLFMEKQNLLESFRRMLERPDSPELVFNHADEKYMGKIRIRQK